MNLNKYLNMDTENMTPMEIAANMQNYMNAIYDSYEGLMNNPYIVKSIIKPYFINTWHDVQSANTPETQYLIQDFMSNELKDIKTLIMVYETPGSSDRQIYSFSTKRENKLGDHSSNLDLSGMIRKFQLNNIFYRYGVVKYYNDKIDATTEIKDTYTLKKINSLVRILNKVYTLKRHRSNTSSFLDGIKNYILNSVSTHYLTETVYGFHLSSVNESLNIRYVDDFILRDFFSKNALLVMQIPSHIKTENKQRNVSLSIISNTNTQQVREIWNAVKKDMKDIYNDEVHIKDMEYISKCLNELNLITSMDKVI